MITEINGTKYIIKWKHQLPKKEVVKIGTIADVRIETIPATPGATTCIIKNYDTGEVINSVTVTCNHKDIYNKETGRKESLAKALNLGRSKKMEPIHILNVVDRNGSPIMAFQLKDTGFLNDDGVFKQADREIVWKDYFASKFDVQAEYDKLVNEYNDLVTKIAVFQMTTGVEFFPDEDNITFIPDNEEDEDGPIQ